MRVEKAQFIISCNNLSNNKKNGIPEVAFVGRSNVGKSSLLNTLLQRKRLAKVSSTPGKTRLINYFMINGKFYFVDLPGYGFAKISKAEQLKWKTLLEGYLINRVPLKGVIFLVDAKVGVMPKDIAMKRWLERYSKTFLVVATKVDRVSRGQQRFSLQKISDDLSLATNTSVIPFSSKTGEGLSNLWKKIQNLFLSS